MVRTGARAQKLQLLLIEAGYRPAKIAPPAPKVDRLPAAARDDVAKLYRALGGQVPTPSLRPGAWDLAFADGVVVELDEELHFNRYRAQSLRAPWATELPWCDAYLGLCDDRERECIDAGVWGKRWANPSCEYMFGPPGVPGVPDERGAPRWKQRALYDAIKDIAVLHLSDVRLCRVSVWDNVGRTTVGGALAGAHLDLEQLAEFIEQRTR